MGGNMKKTTMVRALAVSVGLMATLWPTSGTAHLVSRTDPAGDALGKLDIVKTSFDHGNGKMILSFTIASPWSKADVYAKDCGEAGSQTFKLDTKEDGGTDYFVAIYVDTETNTFTADLYDYEFGQYLERGGFGTITKTKRSLRIEFPRYRIEAYG